jgi:predicted RNA-binding protein YlxR (DUF448 family)
VRLVRRGDGTVGVDADGTAPGRGAYVCAETACLERVLKGGRLGHAFRRPTQAGAGLDAMVRATGRMSRTQIDNQASDGSVAARPTAVAARDGSEEVRGRWQQRRPR